jgi:hypothetical protein
MALVWFLGFIGAFLVLTIHFSRRRFKRRDRIDGLGPARLSWVVIAPRKAWRILQGESPCRGRASHPPVSSLASVAESPEGGEQDRRSVDRESCRP